MKKRPLTSTLAMALRAMAFLCLGFAGLTPLNAQNMQQRQYDMRAENGAVYRIFEAVPNEAPPKQGWPLVLLLDGNFVFSDAIKGPSQAIIIGIGYPTDDEEEVIERRFLDLTTKVALETIPRRPDRPQPNIGGETAFRSFLLNELKPHLFETMPINAEKQVLFGHSLGGIFVLRLLVEKPQSFQTYCAADPSIWWGKHEFLNMLEGFSPPKTPIRLLIEASGKLAKRNDVSNTDAEKARALRAGPNGRDVALIMQNKKHIETRYRRFENDSHRSMMAPSVRDCLLYTITPDKIPADYFDTLPTSKNEEK